MWFCPCSQNQALIVHDFDGPFMDRMNALIFSEHLVKDHGRWCDATSS